MLVNTVHFNKPWLTAIREDHAEGREGSERKARHHDRWCFTLSDGTFGTHPTLTGAVKVSKKLSEAKGLEPPTLSAQAQLYQAGLDCWQVDTADQDQRVVVEIGTGKKLGSFTATEALEALQRYRARLEARNTLRKHGITP